MAQGKKWDDTVKEKVKVLLAVNTPIKDIALQENLSESTIKMWKKNWEDDGTLSELRTKKKEEFQDLYINEAREIVLLANQRIKETIKDASAAQAATIAGITIDKMRLMLGESTDNTQVSGLNIIIGNQVVNKEENK